MGNLAFVTAGLALALSSAGALQSVQAQGACRGWINYQRDTDFKPGLAEFSGLARQNISLLAISMRRSDAPILIQSGGGPHQDAALSERRSAVIVYTLSAEGVDAVRVRVAPAKVGQIAPDGLLIYNHVYCG